MNKLITLSLVTLITPLSLLAVSVDFGSAVAIYEEARSTLPAKYRVPIWQTDNNVNAELVYRYVDKDHPDFSKLYLSIPANYRDPRSACAEEHLVYPRTAVERRTEVNEDLSDIATRAIRTSSNGVVLFGGHLITYGMRGGDISNLTRICSKEVYTSKLDPKFENFRSHEWLTSYYTKDGKNILAIANSDWRAYTELPRSQRGKCSKDTANNCWWAGLTILKSSDTGRSFKSLSIIPKNYVLARPSTSDVRSGWYNPNGITGFYTSSNIMNNPLDGNYYMITKIQKKPLNGQTRRGICLIRAEAGKDLFKPSSWKGHTKNNLGQISFSGNLQNGDCDPVINYDATFNIKGTNNTFKPMEIRHISYNTYLNKFIGLGLGVDSTGKEILALFTTSTTDLSSWDNEVVKIVEADWCSGGPCPSGDLPNGKSKFEIRYPTLIDHDYSKLVQEMRNNPNITYPNVSERYNYDITGQTPWLYFSYKTTIGGVFGIAKLDVVRIPIKLSNN